MGSGFIGFLGFVLAAGQLGFFAFLAWAILTHLKQQRDQSEVLTRIADALERRNAEV